MADLTRGIEGRIVGKVSGPIPVVEGLTLWQPGRQAGTLSERMTFNPRPNTVPSCNWALSVQSWVT
jgi:hypothetical protein